MDIHACPHKRDEYSLLQMNIYTCPHKRDEYSYMPTQTRWIQSTRDEMNRGEYNLNIGQGLITRAKKCEKKCEKRCEKKCEKRCEKSLKEMSLFSHRTGSNHPCTLCEKSDISLRLFSHLFSHFCSLFFSLLFSHLFSYLFLELVHGWILGLDGVAFVGFSCEKSDGVAFVVFSCEKNDGVAFVVFSCEKSVVMCLDVVALSLSWCTGESWVLMGLLSLCCHVKRVS